MYILLYIYAITYAIMSSMKNLHFGKEDYFHVLVFYTSYFIKEIENIFSRVLICYRNTYIEVSKGSPFSYSDNRIQGEPLFL